VLIFSLRYLKFTAVEMDWTDWTEAIVRLISSLYGKAVEEI